MVLSLFPNPCNEEVNIYTDEIIEEIRVFNCLGAEVLKIEGNVSKINLENLTPGIHHIEVSFSYTKEILKLVKN